jgi:transposase
MLVLEQTQDEQENIARVAALDIGKAELVCHVRVPDPVDGSRRVQEVTTYSTMTRSQQLMADRLLDLGVTRVVMEATSAIEATVLPVGSARVSDVAGQRQGRQAPTRAAQDRLAGHGVVVQVAERQMLRPSFVPPVPIRRLRDLTRYRIGLVSDQNREKNWVEKLLEELRSSFRWSPVTSSGSPGVT